MNKLNGLLAEVDFRNHMIALGFGDKVSPGGWIARSVGDNIFGHNTVVFFPQLVEPGYDYSKDRQLPNPPHGLHTICSTFHQIGIASYYCVPTIENHESEDADKSTFQLDWQAIELGLPSEQIYKPFPMNLSGFSQRQRSYNFLRYNTDVSVIPTDAIPEEFSKEHVRISFQNRFMAEVSDVDGIIWGEQYTYPVEIKEKTAGADKKTGPYFGLDIGPFVKLAYYAAKRGNLHSLFIVREIADIESRELIKWWAITFDSLAQYASWILQPGGTNMLGGASAVVKIPKREFEELNLEYIKKL